MFNLHFQNEKIAVLCFGAFKTARNLRYKITGSLCVIFHAERQVNVDMVAQTCDDTSDLKYQAQLLNKKHVTM